MESYAKVRILRRAGWVIVFGEWPVLPDRLMAGLHTMRKGEYNLVSSYCVRFPRTLAQ